ncbi:MAG: GntR family transcriptional regulator [Spirochaetia bacterium]
MVSTPKRETRNLVDRVYEHILDQIITGMVRYGDTISIKKVAGELGVSTMPVREAVKRLELEQVVSIKPRSFCRVRRPSHKMIMEVYELREALEEFAVTKTLGKVDAEAIGRLRGIVERMRSLHAEADAAVQEKKAIELDREFHSQIGALEGSEMLNTYYRQLSLHVNMTFIHEKTYHTLEQGWSEVHAEILRCIESEPARAMEALQRHFGSVRNLLGARESPGSGNEEGEER